MNYRNCLDDTSICAVADASIIINLNSSGSAKTILAALPRRLQVTSIVEQELSDGVAVGRETSSVLRGWISTGLIEVMPLGEHGMNHFSALVAGHTIDTLDDGESATIAYALESNGIALIDERKANRICQEIFPKLIVGSSLDVFRHANVQKVLGKKDLSDTVFRALSEGHMRVLPHHLNWTAECIGNDRAKKCLSLPASFRSEL